MKMDSTNLALAKIILTDKFNKVQKKRTSVPVTIKTYSHFLTSIYRGNHKTYKYILFTALLAKTAFKDEIDPLSLQEGKGVRVGSYDARSLAHKAVVPFERRFLNNALGGSNEPFLNKPARFPTIDKNNPVRAGKDKEKLILLVDNLAHLSNCQAEVWLEESLNILLDIAEENNQKYKTNIELPNEIDLIQNLFLDLTKENFGGEMLTLSLGALMSLLLTNNYTIEVHKINQSGASSKEVGDIDIFLNNEIAYSMEAKSKDFALQDVEHAVRKAKDYGLHSFFFIYNHTTIDKELKDRSTTFANSIEMVLSFLPFEEFLPTILALCAPESFEFLPKTLMNMATEMQISDDALEFTKKTLESYSE